MSLPTPASYKSRASRGGARGGEAVVRLEVMAARELTGTAFEALLLWLDADRERAGEHYERLRRKLVKFFEWRGDHFPEDHADDTLNRVARLLAEGTAVRTEEPARFCYGVARMVLLEVLRERQRIEATEKAHAAAQVDDDRREVRAACLSRCLAGLPDEARGLLLAYYEGASGAQIARRQALALRFGVPAGTLRLRVYRLRERLEPCVRECIGRGTT